MVEIDRAGYQHRVDKRIEEPKHRREQKTAAPRSAAMG
jgi:hypothetical protein